MKTKPLYIFIYCMLTFCNTSIVYSAATIPVDYSTFFATTAISSNGTLLEKAPKAAVGTWSTGTPSGASNPALEPNVLNYSTYVDNSASKAIILPSTSADQRNSVFTITGNTSDFTTGTFYVSFLINVSAAPATVKSFLTFDKFSSGTTNRGRVYIKSSGSGYVLMPCVYSSNKFGGESVEIAFNTTHLVVLKYNVITAHETTGAATATLFVDPVLGNEEPISLSTISETNVTHTDYIKSLVVSQQPGLGARISGLRFSKSWVDVVKSAPGSQLLTPASSAATQITSTGFTAHWSAVSNAQSYDVKVFQNGSFVKTVNTVGQSITSLAITGLTGFRTYTYTITALGDGINNSNSEPSLSKTVTTLDPNAVNSISTNINDGTWGATADYELGSYPSSFVNGFFLNHATFSTGGFPLKYGSKGESHKNSIVLDKYDFTTPVNSGSFTLLTVNSLSQIEIHAYTNSADRNFTLKEFNTVTTAWELVGTYTYNTSSFNSKLDSVYIISLSRSVPSKFRIENAGGGSMGVMQVITRTTALTSLSSPTASAPAQVTNTGFRASWTQVANATGYEIRVFQGSAVRKAVTVNDGATLTADVTGLTPNTTYFYRVAAIADGTGYLNSFLSASGGSFTTANEFSVSSATSSSALTSLNSTSAITVQAGNTFTVNTNATVDNIVLQAGAKLTLSTGNTLTATNGITLQSSTSGTATFVDNNNTSPLSVSGTVEQHLASARNWYLSSPIAGATIPTGQTYYSYDETGSNTGFVAPASLYWVAVPEGTTINPMKGYITQPGAATTKSYTGTFNTGTKTIALTRTNSASKPGFNLVANPYPSYLDWSMVDTTAANIQTSVWYRTKTSGGAYTFDTYNGKLDVATTNGENTVSKLIPPMQAFWVRVKTGFAGGTLTFDNTMRKHADVSGNKMKAPKVSETKVVRLQLSNGTNADEALVCFNSNAQNSFDSYDSPKMFNNVASQPEIYTKANNEKLVINGLNQLQDNQEIPLGFTYTQGGNLKLKLTELSNFDSSTKVYLRDKVDIAEIELAPETEYAFNTAATINNESRFSLIYKVAGVSTGTTTPSNEHISVFINAANQITIIANEKSNYAIYNAMGQLIENGILNTKHETRNSKLGAGVYFVELSVNGQNEIQKVIIR